MLYVKWFVIIFQMGWTPLMIAASAGHLDVLSLLFAHEPDITATNLNGCTALHYAASKQHLKVFIY